ncbi:hypothetical protein QFC21_003271 [Naganishia friedmannii]|uniref:Uncharacterized protein n=1 Tax=Naganishia friedmannii TaxID=89922 RepID=A0ACC2VPF1_9TREE|nr:hypothetical protein QFC21_003271 [Naganishia friedmannii]
MSKPSLTIITTPASAPATQPPSPVHDGETLPTDYSRKDSSSIDCNPSSESNSEGEDGGAHGSPATDEHVGTPGFTQHSIPADVATEQRGDEQVKAWPSTMSTSESVPFGLGLPLIPDETTLQNLTETRSRSRSRSGSRSPAADGAGRLLNGRGDATRSLPSPKAAANQQQRLNQVERGRSPLAQTSAGGPLASSPITPTKSPQTGFKAFIRWTFGIGKGSSEKEQKKAKTSSPSPSTNTRSRQQTVPPVIAGSPVTMRDAPDRVSPVIQAKSPPPIASPVFSPASPSTSGLSAAPPSAPYQNTLGMVCNPADIPLPPSPFIGQDSLKMPSAGHIVSNSSIASSDVPTHHTTMASHRVSENAAVSKISLSDQSSAPTSAEVVEGLSPLRHSPSVNSNMTRSLSREPACALLAETTPVTSRASPGCVGVAYDYNKVMSAIEPSHAPPFSISPITTSHNNGGPGATAGTTAELHGGVTMSRSVTAEGIAEAKDIMDEKQSMLQEASDNLAAYASKHGMRRSVDSQAEAEAMDSVPFDLGFRPRAGQQARKVSPTSSVPKYGRSVSAPGNDRLAPPSSVGVVTAKEGFGRKLSVKGIAPSGTGLTRSGSKLRTSVYGLSDVLHRKDTTPKQKRISLSPTMHTMGSIMQEANEIMDQDERDRAESFFMS